jgi:hypothetical protein
MQVAIDIFGKKHPIKVTTVFDRYHQPPFLTFCAFEGHEFELIHGSKNFYEVLIQRLQQINQFIVDVRIDGELHQYVSR